MSAFYDLNKTPRNLNQAIVRAIVSENNGAWFDPSDLSTLYQDAAGTVPVTAVEQPVGLMLDKSRVMMLGPELVSNGTFDANINGWTQGDSITTTWVNGAASMARSGVVDGSLAFRQSVPVTQGKIYKIMFTASGASVARQISGVTPVTGPAAAGIGTFSFILTAATTSILLNFWPTTDGTTTTLDNISVREIYSCHATQPITASRPTLSARKNVLLATEALATQSVTTLAATYTLSFTGTGSVTLSGAATGTLTGNGTDRVSLTFTPTSGTLTLTVSGSVTKAQIELGAVAGPYQRVNTATDYDTDERYFKKFLRFDGVDDYLNLPYMGLYAGGSASMVAGIKSEDVAGVYSRILAETNSTLASPRYILLREDLNTPSIDISIVNDGGTSILDTELVTLTNGESSIVSVVDSGSKLSAYKNSAMMLNNAYTRAGLVTLDSLTIGAQRAQSGTYNAFTKSALYGLIITKSALTDSQRVACERYLGRKSGVQL